MANPNKLFAWLKYQDIQIPDVTLRTQFQTYMSTGNYNQALLLLSNNRNQLSGKAWIGESANTLANGIIAVENLYNNNVIKFLSEQRESLQSLVDNYRNMNIHIASNEYKAMNFVSFDNEMYMAIQDVPANIDITNTNYWLYVGLRGEQGASGVNVRQQYDYSSTKSYNINDIVVYQDQIYVAIKANTGVLPTNSNNWLLYERVIKATIYVGLNAPSDNLVEGKIWFKTQSDPYTYIGSNPIIGTFMLYHEDGTWEDMYPDTLFDWLEKGTYKQHGKVISLTIPSSGWNNFTYTYSNSNITIDSIVTVMPDSIMSQTAWKQYSRITMINVANGSITLVTQRDMTQDLPVKIIIR